ncbi:hypothetical protein TWF481_010597 [Arthrobotrys musiformis]|uniref:Uncharacterized protein n=1 Tax=Arthrobotrys musiformis TaxID=47236 RepID=A0AAV9W2B8_9PEZI
MRGGHIALNLARRLSFEEPVDDPFYRSDQSNLKPSYVPRVPKGWPEEPVGNPAYTRPDNEPVGVMSCAQQLEVCNGKGGKGNCTGLRSLHDFRHNQKKILDPIFTPAQRSLILSYLLATSQWYEVGFLAHLFGKDVLLANRKVVTIGRSAKLTPNFWHEEVKNLVTIGIIGTIYELRSYALGHEAPQYQVPQTKYIYGQHSAAPAGALRDITAGHQYKKRNLGIDQDPYGRPHPPISREDPFCYKNVVLIDASSTHTTFMMIPFILIIFFGLAIAILSVIMEPLLSRIFMKFSVTKPNAIAWNLDGLNQLFRLAMESAGIISWDKGLTGPTPTTENGMLMALPDQRGEYAGFRRVGERL